MVNIMLSLHEYYVDKLKEFDKVRNLFDENYDKYIPLVLDIFGTLLTAIEEGKPVNLLEPRAWVSGKEIPQSEYEGGRE